MKPLTLVVVVAMGLFGMGCSAEPDDEGGPPAADVKRVASSLERKLAVPIAIPSDTAIGGSIDALVEAHAGAVAREPVVTLGATGRRCSMIRFDDENGVEQMRRERCDGGADTLRVGKLVYRDGNQDGKIDQFSDVGAASYDQFDDDHDGKMDRMIESAERIKAPISLNDFAESVTITSGGTIASRERDDKDHDGKFDVESVTATTSFQIITRPAANEDAH